MASSLSSSCGVARLIPRRKFICKGFQARAQSSHGEDGNLGRKGRSSTSIVDSNLGLLKKRIEMMRMEEGLDGRRVGDAEGWNYRSGYDYKFKRRYGHILTESMKLAELVIGTFGFTILSCSLFLCLVSFVVHRF